MIWTVPVEGGERTLIDTGTATQNNNDHSLSFDNKWLAISSGVGKGEGASKVYVVPASGGTPRLITPEGPSYLHGWSPDDKWLLYTGTGPSGGGIHRVSWMGGEAIRLAVGDGSEYTHDGSKIYFHSTRAKGVQKILRMNPDGSDQEQITFEDEFADWFPIRARTGSGLSSCLTTKASRATP